MLDSPDLLLVNLFKIKVFLLPKISNYAIFLFISNIKFLPRNCWQLMVLTQSLSGMFRNWPDSRQSAHLTISMMVEVKARPNMM